MKHAPQTLGWSASQRRVIVLLAGVVVIYLCFRLVRDNSTVADPQPVRPARELELLDRIDPNVADVPMLAALPGLGEKRAGDIVAFREQFLATNPGGRAYSRAEDLLKVRGIGYAIMTQLSPHLYFPTPATQPAPD